MGHYRITDDAAFELLRRWSQDSNTKIRHIAELLTASAASGVGDRLTRTRSSNRIWPCPHDAAPQVRKHDTETISESGRRRRCT
jgi:ANTAR domain